MNPLVKSVLRGMVFVMVVSAILGVSFGDLLPRVNFFEKSFLAASIVNFYTPEIGAFGFSMLVVGVAGITGISLRVFFSLARFGEANLNDVCGLVFLGVVIGFGFFISSWYAISFARLMKYGAGT